jgi:hypothetical protein
MTFLAFETRVFFTDSTRIGKYAWNYSHEEYFLDVKGPIDLFWRTTATLRPLYSMKNESPFDYYGGVVNALGVFFIAAFVVIGCATMWGVLFWGWFMAWPVPMTAITLGLLALVWIAAGGPRRCRDRRTRRESDRYWASPEGQKILEGLRATEIAGARALETAKAERENRPRLSLRVLRELTADEWRPPPIVLSAELERLVEPCLDVIRLTNTASVPVFMTQLRVSRADAELLADALVDRGILGPRGGDRPQEILVDLSN